MACTRRLSLEMRVLSPRPVVPLSPVRVAIWESLLAMVVSLQGWRRHDPDVISLREAKKCMGSTDDVTEATPGKKAGRARRCRLQWPTVQFFSRRINRMPLPKHSITAIPNANAMFHKPVLTGRLAASSACLMAALAFGAASAHAQTGVATERSITQPAAATTQAPVPENRATSADLDQAFKQTDANGDGKISRAEAVNFPAVLQRFDGIDTDKDSHVSRAELGKAAGA
ncbi:MAG: hypothetical protein EOO54_23345 [Haliea sp.]|nr:MAG: hypothetical protein EOO54_23345 [Haliea sp.]